MQFTAWTIFKVILAETGCVYVDWFHLAHEIVVDFVNTVTDNPNSMKVWNLLARWVSSKYQSKGL
jgi:hypothetical protein